MCIDKLQHSLQHHERSKIKLNTQKNDTNLSHPRQSGWSRNRKLLIPTGSKALKKNCQHCRGEDQWTEVAPARGGVRAGERGSQVAESSPPPPRGRHQACTEFCSQLVLLVSRPAESWRTTPARDQSWRVVDSQQNLTPPTGSFHRGSREQKNLTTVPFQPDSCCNWCFIWTHKKRIIHKWV